MKASGSELNRSLVGRYNSQDELFESKAIQVHHIRCSASIHSYVERINKETN